MNFKLFFTGPLSWIYIDIVDSNTSINNLQAKLYDEKHSDTIK
jgi:hypothetical protein